MSGLQRNRTIKHWMCEHIRQQGRGKRHISSWRPMCYYRKQKVKISWLKKVSMKKEGRKTCEGGSIEKGRAIQGGYRDGCD